MTEENPTITVTGRTKVSQPPSKLLMIKTIKASAPTLEMALTKMRQKCDSAVQLLTRLKATEIEFEEPRFPEQKELGPYAKAKEIRDRTRRVTSALMPGTESTEESKSEDKCVEIVLSGTWPIKGLTSDETLIFLDRLQFETADQEIEPEDSQEQPRDWTSQAEIQTRAMLAGFEEEENEDKCQFYFVSELSEEQRVKAYDQVLLEAKKISSRRKYETRSTSIHSLP